jgi:hypothetical protein
MRRAAIWGVFLLAAAACEPESTADPRSPVVAGDLERALALASGYLVRASGPDGRFAYRVNTDPQVTVEPKYNQLRHAGTIYAMANYHARKPDPELADALRRSAKYLVDQTVAPVDEEKGVSAVWTRPEQTGQRPLSAKLGGAGLALVGLIALEREAPGTTSRETLRALGRFVLFMQRSNGSFHSKYVPLRGGKQSDFVSLYYPGEAALGMVMLYELDGHVRWLQSAADALAHLASSRAGQTDIPADHWALLATARLLRHLDKCESRASRAGLVRHAEQVCESILAGRVERASYPELIGALADDGVVAPTSTRLEGLLAALTFLPQTGNGELRGRIETAVQQAMAFLLPTQVPDGDYRGGFPRAARRIQGKSDRFNRRATEIRIDYVQHAMSAMMQYVDYFHAG